MNVLDLALKLASWLLLAVFVVGSGAALAAAVLWVARRPRRAFVAAKVANMPVGRPAKTVEISTVSQSDAAAMFNVSRASVNTATVRKLREYQTPGALVPVVEAEAEPEDLALAPYTPGPAPLIRIDTGRLPVADSGAGWELERRTPHRTPSVESDFAVPALQAGMTAFAVGVGAALMAWALAWSWRVPVAVMGATFVLSWLWRLRIVDGLLWTVESIIRRDVDGDGQVGVPAPQHAFTLANPAEARSEAAAEVRQQEDDARRVELLAFLDRCLMVGCSESAQGINPSDRAEYLRKRDVLMHLGIAAWKHPERPRAGWHIVVSHERARQLIAKHVL